MADRFSAPINNEFVEFYSELNNIMRTRGHFYINIFSNPDGTAFENDSYGNPIQNRLVNYMMYTYGNYDMSSSQATIGKFRIVFSDLSRFEVLDDQHTISWFSVEGITPVVIHPFT